MYTIVKNESFNSFELTFSGKPSERIRAILNANGYRWHGMRRIWYGYKDIAELLNGETVEQTGTATEQPEQPEQPKANATPIKFYYNGIKLNGKTELVKAGYSLRDDESVTIYAENGGQLPRDLFNVENDTDVYTDYFDDDSANIAPSHPLYRFALYAAKKAEYMRSKSYLKYTEEHPNRYEDDPTAERCRKNIAEFKKMSDPGQPTNADLLKVDEMNERTKAEQQAERQAEEQARAKAEKEKEIFGEQTIREALELYPLTPGEVDFVRITWSENRALWNHTHDENGTETGFNLSFRAAEYVLAILDDCQHTDRGTENGCGWYDKTGFIIYKGGEPVYEGRYDLGDGDGGLCAHVRKVAEWYAKHDHTGKKKDDPTENDLQCVAFAKWLEAATFGTDPERPTPNGAQDGNNDGATYTPSAVHG